MTQTPSMRERMLAGELYIADDPEIGEESARAAHSAAPAASMRTPWPGRTWSGRTTSSGGKARGGRS